MTATPLRIWTRWLNNFKARNSRKAPKRLLNMQQLEGRDVPAVLFGLTENNQIIRFDSANPGATQQIVVTGLDAMAMETLTSIDFRPSNGKLYAVSNLNSKLYTINVTPGPTAGVATFVGSAGFVPGGTHTGIDFNPTVDRIRFISNDGTNSRINPDTGVVTFDTSINGATGSLVEVAYTNNFAGATSTSLFGIDSVTDKLYVIANPNSGVTAEVGALTVDTDTRVGFDIAFDDSVAYASLTVGGVAQLYTINLVNGAATIVGKIGVLGTPLIGLSSQNQTNVPPVVTLPGSVQTYDVDSDVPVLIDPGAIVFDPDSTNFDTGTMKVSLSAGQVGDLVSIRNQGMGAGQVGISGNQVFFGGTQVGTFTTGDGTIMPLTVTFNANSTPAAAQAILRNVTFSTTDNSLLLTNRQAQVVIEDGAGGTGTSGTHEVKLADLTPPSVASIVRVDKSPTNAMLVNFTVTFSENVTGVDVTDFVTTTTGDLAGTTVKSVTMVDAKTYTVQVENLTGGMDNVSPTLRLDVTDDDTIVDAHGNKLGGTGTGNGNFTKGESYTIDRLEPIVIIAEGNGQTDPTFMSTVNFFVSFSETMTGFDASDVVISGTAGATTAKITDLKNGNFNVEVSGATMDGTVIINIAPGAATDAAGNGNSKAIIFDNKITVDLVNNAPVITAPATVMGTEEKTFTFDKTNPISIADSDLNGGKMIVTITATDGTLTLSGLTGLMFTTGDGKADKTMTFSGLQADINTALADLLFTPNANFFGMTTVTIDADDQGATGSGGAQVGHSTVTLDVASVNDAPTITISGAQDHVTPEDTKLTFTKGSFVITDVDAGTDSVKVTLKALSGTLFIADPSKLAFTTGTGTKDATMVFTGSITDINAALDGLSFLPNPDFVTTDALAQVTISVDDQGHNGTGGAMTDSKTIEVTVTAVNDAPVNVIPATQTVAEDATITFNTTNTNLISISDIDAGTESVKVSLVGTNGLITLSGINGLAFTTGDGTGDASMTFTGTIANINAALAGMKFVPNANFNGAATLQIVTDDQGKSGTGGSLTDTDTLTITVTPVNDAPVANNNAEFTTKQNTPLTVAGPGILTNDTDADGDPLTTVIIDTNVPASAGTLTNSGNGGFVFVPNSNFVGTTTFTYHTTDGKASSNVATVTITVTENTTRLFATGEGPGGTPRVIVHNADGTVRFSFDAFDRAFMGGVAVATGDVNGDGVDDIIVGAGPGGGPHVRVLSGTNLGQIHSFMAFDVAFGGGVNVAAGDVNGDGFADIIVGAGPGAAPHVQVFDGRTGSVIQSFLAYDAGFAGGVSVGSGDYNSDGRADIITGAGPGGGPHVLVYSGMTLQILSSFYAFDPLFGGGVNVAGGQFNMPNTDGTPNLQPAIFTAAGPGGVPVVSVYNPRNPVTALASIFATEEADKSGVHIGSETSPTGLSLLYLGAGFGHSPLVRVLDANTLGDQQTFNAFDPSFLGGVFIG